MRSSTALVSAPKTVLDTMTQNARNINPKPWAIPCGPSVRSSRPLVSAPKTMMDTMTQTSVAAISVARCESSLWPFGSKK